MGPTLAYSSSYIKKLNPVTKAVTNVPFAIEAETDLQPAVRVSFEAPCNKLYIEFSSDVSLSRYMVRVTPFDEDWDLDLGTCPVFLTNLAANVTHKIEVPVTDSYFSEDGTYRVVLYAQSALDYIWDITCLFICIGTAGGEKLVTSDGKDVKVYVDTQI